MLAAVVPLILRFLACRARLVNVTIDDSVPVARYLSSPTDNALYNILAFKSDELAQSRHQLLVHFFPGSRSFFDYAIYTVDDLTGDSPAQSPASQSAPTSSTEGADAAKSTEPTPARPSSDHSDTATSGRASETRSGALDRFSEFPSQTLPSPAARAHAPLNLGVVVGVPTAAGTLMVAMCAYFAHWQRRRRRRSAVPLEDSEPAQQEEAVTPFTTRTGPAPPQVAGAKWGQSDALTHTSRTPLGAASDSHQFSTVSDAPPSSSKSRPARDAMAELERVRAESERAQSAYESVRAEIQMLRQALAPPPPYPIAE